MILDAPLQYDHEVGTTVIVTDTPPPFGKHLGAHQDLSNTKGAVSRPRTAGDATNGRRRLTTPKVAAGLTPYGQDTQYNPSQAQYNPLMNTASLLDEVNVERMFDEIDRNGSGVIDFQEFQKAVTSGGSTEP